MRAGSERQRGRLRGDWIAADGSDQGAASRPQHTRRHAGCACDGAAGWLRIDDPDVSGIARVDPGFNPHDALTMHIPILASKVKDPAAVIQLERGILEKIGAIPGVTSAGIATVIPTEPGALDQVHARDKTYQSVPPLRRLRFVSPGLLAAMGNRLVARREFTGADTLPRLESPADSPDPRL